MVDEVTNELIPVGEQLRRAREAMKLGLDDVALSTRIPTRHLAALEQGEWDKLPAATYTLGFAKSYAVAVGLDRVAIGEQLRAEMGGYDPNPYAGSDIFEVIDPKRAMPKWLIVGALVAVVAVIALFSILSNRTPDDNAAANAMAVNEMVVPVDEAPAMGPSSDFNATDTGTGKAIGATPGVAPAATRPASRSTGSTAGPTTRPTAGPSAGSSSGPAARSGTGPTTSPAAIPPTTAAPPPVATTNTSIAR